MINPLKNRVWLCFTSLLIGYSITPLWAASGVLERLAISNTLRIVYPPYAYPIAYTSATGQPKGYAIDLCQEIITNLERALSQGVFKVIWTEGNTSQRMAAIATGEADLDCGTTPISTERSRYVDFSYPIFVESTGIMVRRNAGITQLSDLAGKKVGVIPQSVTLQRLQEALIQQHLKADLVPMVNARAGRDALRAKEIDAFVDDRLVLFGQGIQFMDELEIIDSSLALHTYAFALPRNDADFRLIINHSLAQLYGSPTMTTIFKRWFGAQAQPTPLLNALFFLFSLTATKP
jgi:ABC-type amino acid transport substrate-binding protein